MDGFLLKLCVQLSYSHGFLEVIGLSIKKVIFSF